MLVKRLYSFEFGGNFSITRRGREILEMDEENEGSQPKVSAQPTFTYS